MTNLTNLLNANQTTINNLEDASGKALVNLYNEIAVMLDKPKVAKFASKPAGLKRVTTILAEAYDLAKLEVEDKPKTADKPKVEDKPKTADKPKVEDKPKTADKPKVEDKPKTADKPKLHRASDSWRNLKSLQAHLKENVKIENISFGMSVVGGNEGFLRDQLSVKVKGKRDPLARIKISLGESETRTLYTDESELVLTNDNELVLTEVMSLIEKYIATLKDEAEAKKTTKTEK